MKHRWRKARRSPAGRASSLTLLLGKQSVVPHECLYCHSAAAFLGTLCNMCVRDCIAQQYLFFVGSLNLMGLQPLVFGKPA